MLEILLKKLLSNRYEEAKAQEIYTEIKAELPEDLPEEQYYHFQKLDDIMENYTIGCAYDLRNLISYTLLDSLNKKESPTLC